MKNSIHFYQKIRKKVKISALITSVLHCSGDTLKYHKSGKKLLHIGIEVKLPLFADNVIMYVQNPKEFTKNPLD